MNGDLSRSNRNPITKWLITGMTAVVLLLIGVPTYIYLYKNGGIKFDTGPSQTLKKVISIAEPKDSYDVIVVGTDPEGVTAAISSARNGLKTLLVDGRNRDILGGLFTIGWLSNPIDLNQDKDNLRTLPGQKPAVLNKGIFSEWFNNVEGTTFDVVTGANAFYELVRKEKNIDLLLQTKSMKPIVGTPLDKVMNPSVKATVQGVTLELANGSKRNVKAKVVIDATQDADIAAAAGVPFTLGREDLGDAKSQMAVTTVFRISNVDADLWQKIAKRLSEDGDYDTDTDERSAWGYSKMSGYQPLRPDRIKMRGLNIGRQNDQTALINALQIFGVDPFDPKSVEEAKKLAEAELPRVVEYMKQLYPEFAPVQYVNIAPELYVRETRHMQGLYRLTILDVLDNRDQWDRIAFGSYRVDLQRTSPTDNGAEILAPYKFAVPFRSIVPQQVDGILVVGRSASYDTLPHGSARVVPTGMAAAEAAGVAAKLSIDSKISFRELAANKTLVSQMQDMLNKQGMDLKPYKVTPSASNHLTYMTHKQYDGLKTAVYIGIAIGGGLNDFKLNDKSNPQRLINHMVVSKKVFASKNVFKGDPAASLTGLTGDAKSVPLTLSQACYTLTKTLGLDLTREQAQKDLETRGMLTKATLDTIAAPQSLTNGDVYMLLKDFLEGSVNLKLQ
jgi:hypothetical protein